MAAGASMVAAASLAARGLLAEEVTPKAAASAVDQQRGITGRAAVRTAGLKLAAISARPEIIRRTFVPQSMMASGIRLATPVVPRVSVKDAIPEAWRTQASPLVTPEVPRAVGTLLARQEARPVSSAEPPERRRASVGMVLVGEAVGLATAGAVASVGVGEVGASASDGRTGDLAGRSAGILGGTTLIGMPRGRHTPTRITTTTGPTIRLRTIRIRRITTTRREAT